MTQLDVGVPEMSLTAKVNEFSHDASIAIFDRAMILCEFWLYLVFISVLIYWKITPGRIIIFVLVYWILFGLKFECFWLEAFTNIMYEKTKFLQSPPCTPLPNRIDTSIIISFNEAEDVDLETARTNYSINSLHFAALRGDMGVLREVVKDRPDLINSIDQSKATSLQYACYEGYSNAVEFLLDHGALHHLKDADGWTALMNAAVVNRAEVLRQLLYRKADVNATNNQGWTALMIACDKGHINIVKILLDAGSNINYGKQCTALMIASQQGHQDVAIYLMQRGADIFAKAANGDTAFTYASRAGLYKVLVEYVNYDYNIYQTNKNGFMALPQYKSIRYLSTGTRDKSDSKDIATIELFFRRRNNYKRRRNFLIYLSASKLIVNNYKDNLTDINKSTSISQAENIAKLLKDRSRITFQDFETNQKRFEDSKINFDFVIKKYEDSTKTNYNRFNQYWNSNSSHHLVLSDVNLLSVIASYL